jgi:hypothetical protein
VHNSSRLFPNIINNSKIIKKQLRLPKGLNLKAVFKGTSLTIYPKDASIRNKNLPCSLYLGQHYNYSKKERSVGVIFNVDSVYYFLSSLVFI